METELLLTLLLPWFPIVLAVGVGGRLLGRTHGLAMGILCALFWVVLVQASKGPSIWGHSWTVVTIVTGAIAIVAMGGWAASPQMAIGTLGESAEGSTSADGFRGSASGVPTIIGTAGQVSAEGLGLRAFSAAIDRFDDWLEEHGGDSEPWARFDEFIRSTLYDVCAATHVKSYRLAGGSHATAGDEELISLRDSEIPMDIRREPLSARRGIIGHVVTTGRSYVAGDTMQGDLVEELAAESVNPDLHRDSPTGDPPAWCFAIRQGPLQGGECSRRLGVVVVGQLGIPPQARWQVLGHAERLVNQFWRMLLEASRSRQAMESDSVSGLPIRSAFIQAAELSLRESYKQGEPVAVAVIALEGLRQLSDSGRWEAADELVREVGARLRQKLRTDDRLGRFDESRVAVLLRRVDSELASLIVSQTMSRVAALCSDKARWRADIKARCGVVGSGVEQPDLHTLLSGALQQYQRARTAGLVMASDLESRDNRVEGCGTNDVANAAVGGGSK